MSRSFFLSLLSLTMVMTASGAGVSPGEAVEIARNFLNSGREAEIKTAKRLTMSPIKFGNEIYVVNFEGDGRGGWVLVSADDELPRKVLAYSDSGRFSPDSLSPGALSVLQGYAASISSVAGNGKRTAEAPSTTAGSVAPLLGETAWGQWRPYNDLCPELDGIRCLTGCVNTAIGQIMYYHKYPARGKGEFSYNWRGETLSVDFSRSEYKWDLMLPDYTGGESEESRNAVAKLIYDCGVANSSDYGTETGANLNIPGMVEFFGYDKGVFRVQREKCTREYYENLLRHELDAGRPLFYEGGSAQGGHAFVCDGYDTEGYFHFNFGWNGNENGYYLTSATGYDSAPCFLAGIRPPGDDEPGLWAYCTGDLLWTGGSALSCDIHGEILTCIPADMEVGLLLADPETGAGEYFVTDRYDSMTGFDVEGFVFDENLSDGTYILCPVYRISGKEWRKVCFADNYIDHVDLVVENGELIFSNPDGREGEIDPGVVKIDNFYYSFEENNATLTRRNSRGKNYSGSMVIPETVTYEGMEYPVTSIGESAFEDCVLDTLEIGGNVRRICFGAFSGASVAALKFSANTNLMSIDGWAFNGTSIDEVRIPYGVYTIERCGFQSCRLKQVTLPESIEYIAPNAFGSCPELRDVYVSWMGKEWFPYCTASVFPGCDTEAMTLHVPPGTSEIYRDDEIWGIFGEIVEDSEPYCESVPMDPDVRCIDGMYYSFLGDEAILTRRNQFGSCYSGNILIPDYVEYEGRVYPVVSMASGTFERSRINRVEIGSNLREIPVLAFRKAMVGEIVFASAANLETIAAAAFNQCMTDELVLPRGVKSIGWCAFEQCAFRKIDIPASTLLIDGYAFHLCSGLKDVYVHWGDDTSLPECGDTPFRSCDMSEITLHVPPRTSAMYRNDKTWGEFSRITEDSDLDIATGYDDIESENLRLVSCGEGWVFEGIPENEYIEVFNAAGVPVGRFTSGDIWYATNGVYMIKTRDTVLKICR